MPGVVRGDAFQLGLSYKQVHFRADCTGDCRELPNAQGTSHAVDVGGQLELGAGGAFRVGVSQQLVVRALSQLSELPADVITHRAMGD